MVLPRIDIVYQDKALIIVDKPGGLLSVPGRGPDKQDCAVNRLKALVPGIIEQPAVHRLDMDTSGLMILAKTAEAHTHLSRQFAARSVQKTYIALLDGTVHSGAGKIRLAFRLDPVNRPYQVYDPIQGKVGITRWKHLNIEGKRSRIQFEPLTGRTHQLRLHAAHPLGLGVPIAGDRLYGNGIPGDRLLLHACRLRFDHPENGRPMDITSHCPFLNIFN